MSVAVFGGRVCGGYRPPLQEKMIIRARVVVTMDGPSIDNGAVAIEADRVVDVGTFDEIRGRHSGEMVDLGEQALLPGLINAHCHLDYTCLRGKFPPPRMFTDWISAIVSEKEKLSAQDYIVSIYEGFAEAKKFGTTTMANLTAFPELVPQVNPPIRTWWFSELIDVRSVRHGTDSPWRAFKAPRCCRAPKLGPRAACTVYGFAEVVPTVRRDGGARGCFAYDSSGRIAR